jgi:hypothetical protein
VSRSSGNSASSGLGHFRDLRRRPGGQRSPPLLVAVSGPGRRGGPISGAPHTAGSESPAPGGKRRDCSCSAQTPTTGRCPLHPVERRTGMTAFLRRVGEPEPPEGREACAEIPGEYQRGRLVTDHVVHREKGKHTPARSLPRSCVYRKPYFPNLLFSTWSDGTQPAGRCSQLAACLPQSQREYRRLR